MQLRKQIIVDDVLTSEIFVGKASQKVLLEEGLRAVIATPLLSSMGDISGMLTAHFEEPHRPEQRESHLLDLLARQAADYLQRKHAEEMLRHKTEELDSLLDLTPIPICISTDPECREIRVNRAAANVYRIEKDKNISQTSAESGGAAVRVPHYADGRELLPNELPMQRAAATGKRWHEREIDLMFPNGDRVTISGQAVPLFDSRGKVRGAVGAFADITEIKRDQERLQKLAEERLLLVQELNHRVKNTLAIVQALVGRTLRHSEDLREARTLLDGRLVALSEAHEVLALNDWHGGSLRDLLNRALPSFWLARIRISGPDVTLRANQLLKMSMAVFELATNAVKYGALSNDTGYVTISWALGRAGTTTDLELTWAEHGGPPVKAPSRKGYGSQILQGVLAHDVNATVLVNYNVSGLVAVIKLKEVIALRAKDSTVAV